jgi:hypothetical protein
MRVEHVALPTCPECGRQWLPDNKEPWRADLGGDALDEPAEIVFYCRD